MNAPLRLIKELSLDEVNKVLREIQDNILPPGLQSMSVLGSRPLTLTTSYQAIPGLNLQAQRSGLWLIVVAAIVEYKSADGIISVTVQFGSGPSTESDCAQVLASADTTFAVSRQWIQRLQSGAQITAKAKKDSGAAASVVSPDIVAGNQGSRMDAIWLAL